MRPLLALALALAIGGCSARRAPAPPDVGRAELPEPISHLAHAEAITAAREGRVVDVALVDEGDWHRSGVVLQHALNVTIATWNGDGAGVFETGCTLTVTAGAAKPGPTADTFPAVCHGSVQERDPHAASSVAPQPPAPTVGYSCSLVHVDGVGLALVRRDVEDDREVDARVLRLDEVCGG